MPIKLKSNVILSIIFIIVIAIWIVNLVVTLNWNFDDRGTFGDMFGASNALFSGLAFAGIVYTIHLQRKELSRQKIEIEQTKNNIGFQEFRSTYFNLLNLHQEIVNSLEITDINENKVSGRMVFKRIYEQQKKKDGSIQLTEQNINDLGHYFRDIYRILKFADTYDLKTDSDYKYITNKFLRSQLSSFELILVCYWGLTEEGNKCKQLMEKYSLFSNIPKTFKTHKKLQKAYNDQAFYPKNPNKLE
tara:strand:+ start:2239 stop:2976 length:738 start_codon:yes stop_codon:yes gene_type:complete